MTDQRENNIETRSLFPLGLCCLILFVLLFKKTPVGGKKELVVKCRLYQIIRSKQEDQW